MSSDLSTQIQDIVEWVTRILSGLGFFLPIAIFAIVNLFSKGKKKDAPEPSTTARPRTTAPRREMTAPTQPQSFPFGPPAWMDMIAPKEPTPAKRQDDGYQHQAKKRNTSFDRADETLRWGSAFDDNDAARGKESLKWGSPFAKQAEAKQWGFDETEWGGGFAPKKNVEPTITVG